MADEILRNLVVIRILIDVDFVDSVHEYPTQYVWTSALFR